MKIIKTISLLKGKSLVPKAFTPPYPLRQLTEGLKELDIFKASPSGSWWGVI